MRLITFTTALLLMACVDVADRPLILVAMAQDSSYTVTFTDQIKGLNAEGLSNVLFQLGQTNNTELASAAREKFTQETGQDYRQALTAAMFTPFNGKWLLDGDTVSVNQGSIAADSIQATLAIMDNNSIVIQPIRGGKALLTRGKDGWSGTVNGQLIEFEKLEK